MSRNDRMSLGMGPSVLADKVDCRSQQTYSEGFHPMAGERGACPPRARLSRFFYFWVLRRECGARSGLPWGRSQNRGANGGCGRGWAPVAPIAGSPPLRAIARLHRLL
jgi:hypothetical protein